MIRCLKKLNMLDSKNMKGKFMIYVDFESTLVPEDNERQNPEESYMNKYQKQVAWSYGYKSVCADDKFSKSLKSYLDEDADYILWTVWLKKVSIVLIFWKNRFNKELAMTKRSWTKKELAMTMTKRSWRFENSSKCWISDHVYVECDVKVRDHYHITGKYRGSTHRECNSNVKLNHKIHIVFGNLKNHDTSYFTRIRQIQS